MLDRDSQTSSLCSRPRQTRSPVFSYIFCRGYYWRAARARRLVVFQKKKKEKRGKPQPFRHFNNALNIQHLSTMHLLLNRFGLFNLPFFIAARACSCVDPFHRTATYLQALRRGDSERSEEAPQRACFAKIQQNFAKIRENPEVFAKKIAKNLQKLRLERCKRMQIL